MATQDSVVNGEAVVDPTGGAAVARTTKAKGKKRGPRKKRAAGKRVAKTKTATTRAPRKKASRRRYTPQERQHILDTAKRDGLTGKQVAAKFGVSTLSYYTWRKKAGKSTAKRRGRPPGRTNAALGRDGFLEGAIQARLRQVLPEIVRREVERYLDQTLGRS